MGKDGEGEEWMKEIEENRKRGGEESKRRELEESKRKRGKGREIE